MPKYKNRYVTIPTEIKVYEDVSTRIKGKILKRKIIRIAKTINAEEEFDLFEKYENSILFKFINLEIDDIKVVDQLRELIEFDTLELISPQMNITQIDRYEDFHNNKADFSNYLILLQNDLRGRLIQISPNLKENSPEKTGRKKPLLTGPISGILSDEELSFLGTLKYVNLLGNLELIWEERPVAIWQIIMRSFLAFITDQSAVNNIYKCLHCERIFYPTNSKGTKFCDPKCGKKHHGAKPRPGRYDLEKQNHENLKKRRGYGYGRFN